MPEGAIYVGRPSKWGNPYTIEEFGLELSLNLYAMSIQGCWVPGFLPDHLVTTAYEIHCAFLKTFDQTPLEDMYYELRGRDLACWCSLDQGCHADVLLELANAGTGDIEE